MTHKVLRSTRKSNARKKSVCYRASCYKKEIKTTHCTKSKSSITYSSTQDRADNANCYCTSGRLHSPHANASNVTLEKPCGMPDARVNPDAAPFTRTGAAGAVVCAPAKNRWFCESSLRFSSSASVNGDTYPFSCDFTSFGSTCVGS